MTRVPIALPFAGLRYHRADLSGVLAPPYDIVRPDDQERLRRRDAYNVVRLELGYTEPHAAEDGARYSAAAATLRRWREEGILGYDDGPCLYPCAHTFTLRGEARTRVGVICAVRLTPFEEGLVLPHEGTLRGPREDRRRLMLACQAQISPVFALHDDASGQIASLLREMMAEEPVAEATANGDRHRLWRCPQGELANRYCGLLGEGPLFIADGHHRYETALAVSRELRQAYADARPDAAFNFVLALLCPAEQPGMVILPTHRLLSLGTPERRAHLEALTTEHFESRAIECAAGHAHTAARTLVESIEQADRAVRFGIYTRADGCRLLVAKPASLPQDPGSGGINELSTVLAHRLLIDPVIGPEGLGSDVAYVMDEVEAVRRVDEGEADCALFLRPTTVAQVKRVAAAGLRMPGKSTYFYPKAPTGLVISDISPERTIP